MIRRFSDEYRRDLRWKSDKAPSKPFLKSEEKWAISVSPWEVQRSDSEELYDTEEIKKAEVNVISFDTMMFIRIFLDLDLSSKLELTPSVYMREMSFSHEERQICLRSNLRKNNHLLTQSYPDYIKLTPPIVVFQNCEPDEISSVKLSLMNIGRKSICLQISTTVHEAFSVKNVTKGDKRKKIAQGMEHVYEIIFRPSQLKDYYQNMKVIVSDTEFEIPFYGLGPRALIDFPDIIEMPIAPVKLQVTKTVIIKNIGRARGIVNFSTEAPFTVVPEKICLDTEQELAWKINFISNTKGLFYRKISVLYENGELLNIDTICTADNLNIYINEHNIDFGEIFIGNKKSCEIEIHNESGYLVEFHFLKYRTLEEDMKYLERLNKRFFQLKEIENKNSALLDYHEITLPGIHEAATERIYNDQVKFTSIKDLMFKNVNFEILPIEGEIWPWTSSTVTLIFTPTEVGDYSERIYCEIQGREERIPLLLKGVGIGPKLSFNVDTVDFGYIFFCSVHKYEIIAKNKGCIPGTLKYLDNKLIFGGSLDCSPKEIILEPGDIKPILLTITSKTVGQFVEEIFFEIKESKKKIKCIMKGKVVSPILTFSEDRIDFGEVPLGFPITHYISVHNESPVTVPFVFKVLKDGIEPAMTCWEAAKSDRKVTLPKEFTVSPLEGEIEPNKSIDLSVCLIASYRRYHATFLKLLVWNFEFEELTIPLTYRATQAIISCYPPEVIMHYAFIGYEYKKEILLENKSNTATFYNIIEDGSEQSQLIWRVTEPYGIIKAKSVKKIIIEFLVKRLSESRATIYLKLYGEEVISAICKLIVTGIGPLIIPSVEELNWGRTNLHEPKVLTFELNNICVIPAMFRCDIKQKIKIFVAEPVKGELLPGEKKTISITALLVDAGPQTAELLIQIKNSRTIKIKLISIGEGCSLIFTPDIKFYDFGEIFRGIDYSLKVTIANQGSKSHSIVFTTTKGDKNYKSVGSNTEGKYIKICPRKLSIASRSKTVIEVQIRCDEFIKVEEHYFMYGIIGYGSKSLCLDELHFVASIVEPKLHIYPEKIEFEIFKTPNFKGSLAQKVQVELYVFHPTKEIFSLTVCGSITFPFFILQDDQLESSFSRNLKRNNREIVTVYYNPKIQNDNRTVIRTGYLSIAFENRSDIKTVIPVIAKVYYPSIAISTPIINFGFLKPYAEYHEYLIMRNNGPLTAKYCWHWVIPKNSDQTIPKPDWPSLIKDPFLKTKLPQLSEKATENLIHNNLVMRSTAFPFIAKYFSTSIMAPLFDELPPPSSEWINQLVTITPFKGELKGYESVALSVKIQPTMPMDFKARAICKIQGAESESLTFIGRCTDIDFCIQPKSIDYGFAPFCEYWTQFFSLKNTGDGLLPWRILMDEKDLMIMKKLSPNVFKVEPSEGIIKPGQEKKICVIYYPGLIGKVDKSFYIEMAYSDLIPVKIEGYATLQQILLNLPRDRNFIDLPAELCYDAISSIPPELYLKPQHSTPVPDWIPDEDEVECLMQPPDFLPNTFEYDWAMIPLPDEFYISNEEIELAVERSICKLFIENNKDYLLCHANRDNVLRETHLGDLETIPYMLDFGKVIMGESVYEEITVYNVCCHQCVVQIALPQRLFELSRQGIKFHTGLTVVIPPKDDTVLKIELSPEPKFFPYKENLLLLTFYLHISCGPSVPVLLKATITVPDFNCESYLNFGTIKCGQRKEMYFRMINNNLVPCEWSSRQRCVHRKNTDHNEETEYLDSLPSPFLPIKTSGILPECSFEDFLVIFQPIAGGKHERVLVFDIISNPKLKNVRLKGIAEEPQIIVEPEFIDFGCQAIYSDIYVKEVTVTNPCSFPIEVFLPQYDKFIVQEETIFSDITRYFNKRHIFVPESYFSVSMDAPIINAYYVLGEKALEAWYEKQAEQQKSTKKDKSPSSGGESKMTLTDASKMTLPKLTTPMAKGAPPLPPIAQKVITKTEIIEEYLKMLEADPPEQREDIFMIPHPEVVIDFNYDEGTLVMTFGTPYSDHIYWSNKVARKLSILPVTLDDIFLGEVATSDSQAAYDIRTMINKEFAKQIMRVNPENTIQKDQQSDSGITDAEKSIKDKVACLFDKYKDAFIKENIDVMAESEEEIEEEEMGEEELDDEESKNTKEKKKRSNKHLEERASNMEDISQVFYDDDNHDSEASTASAKKKKGKKQKKGEDNEKEESTAEMDTGLDREKFAFDESGFTQFLNIPIASVKELIGPKILSLATTSGILIGSLIGMFFDNPVQTVIMLLDIVKRLRNIHLLVFQTDPEDEILRRATSEFQKKLRNIRTIEKVYHYIDGLSGFEFTRLPERVQQLFKQMEKNRIVALDSVFRESTFNIYLSRLLRVLPLQLLLDELNDDAEELFTALVKPEGDEDVKETDLSLEDSLLLEEDEYDILIDDALIDDLLSDELSPIEEPLEKIEFPQDETWDMKMEEYDFAEGEEEEEEASILGEEEEQKMEEQEQEEEEKEMDYCKILKPGSSTTSSLASLLSILISSSSSSTSSCSSTSSSSLSSLSSATSEPKSLSLSSTSSSLLFRSPKPSFLKTKLDIFDLYDASSSRSSYKSLPSPPVPSSSASSPCSLSPSSQSYASAPATPSSSVFSSLSPSSKSLYYSVTSTSSSSSTSSFTIKETPTFSLSSPTTPSLLSSSVSSSSSCKNEFPSYSKLNKRLKTFSRANPDWKDIYNLNRYFQRNLVNYRTIISTSSLSSSSSSSSSSSLASTTPSSPYTLSRSSSLSSDRKSLGATILKNFESLDDFERYFVGSEEVDNVFEDFKSFFQVVVNIYLFLEKYNRILPELTFTKPAKGGKTKKEDKKKAKKKTPKKGPSKAEPKGPAKRKSVEFLLSQDTIDLLKDISGIPVTIIYKSDQRSSDFTTFIENIDKVIVISRPPKFYDFIPEPRKIHDCLVQGKLPPIPMPHVFFWLMQPLSKEDAQTIPTENVDVPLSELTIQQAWNAVTLHEKRDYPTEKLDSSIQIVDHEDEVPHVDIYGTAPQLTRKLLAPGDSVSWTITFFPVTCASIERVIVFEVDGWRKSAYKLVCKASADIPCIAFKPEIIFPAVCSKKVKSNIPTYIKKKQRFHFGMILVPKYKDKSSFRVKSDFTLRNTSKLPIVVTVTYQKNLMKEKIDHFGFAPSFLYIQPLSSKPLTVYANPQSAGLQSENIVLCIQHNPEPIIIKISCHGVRGRCIIEPKDIVFEKLMLLRKATKYVSIRNISSLPLNWKIGNVTSLYPQITPSIKKGKINPHTTIFLWLTYHATVVESVVKTFPIEIYDQYWRGDPVFTEKISIVLASYDVSVTVLIPESVGNHLDYGNIKAGKEYTLQFSLQNDSPTDIIYRMSYEAPKDLLCNPYEIFEISEEEGILPANSAVTDFELKVKCPFEVIIKEVPILLVKLYHPEDDLDLIATLPMPISMSTTFSSFKIYPLPELNFGIMDVDGFKSLEMTIENTGNSDFTFAIISQSELEEYIQNLEDFNNKGRSKTAHGRAETALGKKNRRSTAPGAPGGKQGKKSRKGKKDTAKGKAKEKPKTGKGKTPGKDKGKGAKAEKQAVTFLPKSIGPFIIQRTAGSLLPKEFMHLRIDYQPKVEGEHAELILIEVSGSPENLRYGVPVTLRGIASYPVVDFNDINTMFRRVDIVDNFNSLDPPTHGRPVCAYATSESILEFYNTVVGYKHSADILIENKGLVTAVLQISIEKVKQGPDIPDENVFSLLSSPEMYIQPYSSEAFTVQFAPISLQPQMAQVKLKLKNSPGMKHVVGVVNLRGTGEVPLITIIYPKVPDVFQGEPINLDFPSTETGKTSQLYFIFKNTGPVIAKVLVEVIDNKSRHFYLKAEDTKVMDVFNLKEIYEETVIVTLECQEEALFHVFFAPKAVGMLNCIVKLHVVENSFVFYEVHPKGYAFTESITFEGISYIPQLSPKGKQITRDAPYYYELSFNDCVTRIMYFIKFKATNNTENIYRIVFPTHKNFQFVPRIAHILPKKQNSFFVLLHAPFQINISNTLLTAKYEPINYREKDNCEQQWSCNPKLFLWLSEQQSGKLPLTQLPKIGETSSEPEYINLGVGTEVPIYASAVSDYPFLRFGASTVEFLPTFIYQTDEKFITVENMGEVTSEFTVKAEVIHSSVLEANPQIEGSCSIGLFLGNHLYPIVEGQYSRPRTAQSAASSYRYDLPLASTKSAPKPLSATEPFLNEECQSFASDDHPITRRADIPSNTFLRNRIIETDIIFSVEPAEAVILPGETLKLKLIFKPLKTFDYIGRITLRGSGDLLSEVELRGFGKSAYCHIEHEESDYLTSGRRSFLNLVYSKDTKVIELRTVGVNTAFIKRFIVYNPTSFGYHFSWVEQHRSDTEFPIFVCSSPEGVIEARKGTTMVFGFLPQEAGTFESLWHLVIPQFQIDQPILFVGITRDPLLSFSPHELKLRPTMKGIPSFGKVTLFNKEDIELYYNIDNNSLFSKEQDQKLNVEPMSGKIQPQSEEIFSISFDPKFAREIMFLVKFKIKKMRSPMVFRVLTKCFETECILSYQKNMHNMEIMSSTQPNIIDIGKLNYRIPTNVLFVLQNTGKIPFYYDWYAKASTLRKHLLEINWNLKAGIIHPQEEANFSLSVTALGKDKFEDVPLKLKTTKGPEYVVLLKGTSSFPSYSFNFNKFSFGPRIIQDNDFCFNETNLTFTNMDTEPIMIEKVSQIHPDFTIDFKSQMVPPRSSVDIKAEFYPKEVKNYNATFEFLVNGVYKEKVKLSGMGEDLQVCLKNLADGIVNFIDIPIGTEVSKKIVLYNKSNAITKFILYSVRGVEVSNPIVMEPRGSITMKPLEELPVLITYAPKLREQEYAETVMLDCQGTKRRLLVIRASSIGYKFNLDKPVLPFGMTIIGCSCTLNVALINSGEIGSRYYWDFESISDIFSINPQEGYSCPGSSVVFEVTFLPNKLIKALRKEVFCYIENHDRLSLYLSGTCVELPPSRDYVFFDIPVREKQTKYIPLTNKSYTPIVVKPVLSGEWFYGSDSIDLPPKTTVDYKITYSPLVMTIDEQEHIGNAFFPFPDGSSLIYGLQGIAKDPLVEGEPMWTTKARTNFNTGVPVKNWLKYPQRFSIEIQSMEKEETLYRILGNNFLDVPGGGEREHALIFTAAQKGKVKFKIIFTNDITKEYLYFNVTVIVLPPDEIIDILTLITDVRQPIIKKIYFDNVYEKPVTVAYDSKIKYLRAINPILQLEPGVKGCIELEFYPIMEFYKPKEFLKFSSKELGTFMYECRLLSNSPKLEEPIYLTESLGFSDIFKIPIHLARFSKAQVTVKSPDVRIENSQFETDVYGRGILNIFYEPTFLGDRTVIMEITSEESGKYKYPLMLKALPPKPKGPYIFRPDQEQNITFKNVFTKKYRFICSCRVPAFTIKVNHFELAPKQVRTIPIKMASRKHLSEYKFLDCPITANLRIICTDPQFVNVHWDFYLKGVLDLT